MTETSTIGTTTASTQQKLSVEDFLKAVEALKKANIKPPYRAIIAP